MSIDTTIEGDPESIYALADWVENLRKALADAKLELVHETSGIGDGWTGEASDAFAAAGTKLQLAISPVVEYLDEVRQVYRAYAYRLELGRTFFDEILENARAEGLRYQGNTLYAPITSLRRSPNAYLPTGSRGGSVYQPAGTTDWDQDEWDKYVRLVQIYDAAAAKVGQWEIELAQWIKENMMPLVSCVEEFDPILELFDGWSEAAPAAVEGTLAGVETRIGLNLASWKSKAQRIGGEAREANRGRRSGTPARKAAAEAFDGRGARTTIGGLEAEIKKAGPYAKIVPRAGYGLDLVFMASDIADGADLTTSLFKTGVGMATGAAGAAIGAGAASNPVGWAIAGAVGLGWAGSKVAEWAWEATVPLDWREKVHFYVLEDTLFDPTKSKLKP